MVGSWRQALKVIVGMKVVSGRHDSYHCTVNNDSKLNCGLAAVLSELQ